VAGQWLHISDLHFRGGDAYDRDVVTRALIRSVPEFAKVRRVDAVFVTGDIAQSGRTEEYVQATAFFDALLAALGLGRDRLFVVPGNHDVDRTLGVGLARTLETTDDADAYFRPGQPKPHLTNKFEAFRSWYDTYFRGFRCFPTDSTCATVETIKLGDVSVGILLINSAAFCQDDHDHDRLLIGRRCLGPALESLRAMTCDLRLAVVPSEVVDM